MDSTILALQCNKIRFLTFYFTEKRSRLLSSIHREEH
jgi:hypothetical protein